MNKKRLNGIFFLLLVVVSLIAQDQSPYVQILISPENNSFDYKVGEEVKLRVSVLKNNIPMDNIFIQYSYGLERMPFEKKDSVKIKNNSKVISIGTLKEPGFKKCIVSAKVDNLTYTGELTVAFSPELIKPTVEEPKDFDMFWKNGIKNMRKAEYNVNKTVLEEYSTNDLEVSKIYFKVPKSSIYIYGYLSKPKKMGKYPALIYFPGSGIVNSIPYHAILRKNLISLSVEIHGLDPQATLQIYDDIRNAFGGYRHFGIENKDTYYFRHVILGCIKAADYLCELPEFNGKDFVTYGASQGGYLSIVTASLHERVSCLVAYHPAMSDQTGYLHGRTGGWPHLLGSNIYNSQSEIVNTLSYYDTVNFAKRLKVPGFYSFGYNDNVCPPTSVFAVINSIRAEKEVFITPVLGHWRIPETEKKARSWVEDQFNTKVFELR